MHEYIFVVGTHELCLAELTSVLSALSPDIHIQQIQKELVTVSSPAILPVTELISELGGTIKIAEKVVVLADVTPEAVATHIESPHESLTFGISLYGNISLSLHAFHAQIKTLLSKKFASVRYVSPSKDTVLSSVVISKQHVTEYIITSTAEGWLIGKTIAVQDIDAWSKRDYGRPQADAKSGMLPPKVARMMVNLVHSQPTTHNLPPTLFDPFCGMGTVLAEALLMGWNVIGSDILPDVIKKAHKNLEWLVSQYPDTKNTYTLHIADATHLGDFITPLSLDAIVTEPFMGSPFEFKKGMLFQKNKKVTVEIVQNTIKGLEKLYTGAFKKWHTLLKPEGKIVITLPAIWFENRLYPVKRLIDNCENLGYTLSQGPHEYSRPQTVVKRHIYVFKKL